MPRVYSRGTLPSSIVENSTASGWAGTLALEGDLAGLQDISLVGSGASYFSIRFDMTLGLAVLTPAARVARRWRPLGSASHHCRRLSR